MHKRRPPQESPLEANRWDYDEVFVQTAIVIVTSLLSVIAMLIFLAAVLPF
jgi:hypothetical protein